MRCPKCKEKIETPICNECDAKIYARGLCKKHYQKKKFHEVWKFNRRLKMKSLLKVLILVLALSVFTNCGSSGEDPAKPCDSSQIAGKWTDLDDSSWHLTFDSGCHAGLDNCASDWTISQIDYAKDGEQDVTLTVASSNESLGCLPKGTYSCKANGASVNGVLGLAFSCPGYGTSIYFK